MNKSVSTLIGNTGYGKEVKTSDLLEELVPNRMIPVSLRWHDPVREIYVLEYPPGHRLIYRDYHEDDGGPFRIPMPWQVYICSIQPRDVKFFVRTEQLTSLDDMLHHQFMSNIYRSGTPCQGAQGELREDPIDTCRSMIDAIWMTTFNGGCYISSDGAPHAKAYKDPGGSLQPQEIVDAGFNDHFWASSKIHEWLEERSIDEMLSWQWKHAGTLRELIEWSAPKKQWDSLSGVFSRLDSKAVQTEK